MAASGIGASDMITATVGGAKYGGASPKGWTSVATGRGAAKWTIEKDDTAPAGRGCEDEHDRGFRGGYFF